MAVRPVRSGSNAGGFVRVWSSAADAPRLRRPTDVLLLVASVVVLGLLALAAPGPTGADRRARHVARVARARVRLAVEHRLRRPDAVGRSASSCSPRSAGVGAGSWSTRRPRPSWPSVRRWASEPSPGPTRPPPSTRSCRPVPRWSTSPPGSRSSRRSSSRRRRTSRGPGGTRAAFVIAPGRRGRGRPADDEPDRGDRRDRRRHRGRRDRPPGARVTAGTSDRRAGAGRAPGPRRADDAG